jgi:hypothetical protein
VSFIRRRKHIRTFAVQKGHSNSTGLECEGQCGSFVLQEMVALHLLVRSGHGRGVPTAWKDIPGGGDIWTWWRATSALVSAVWLCIYLPCDQSHTLSCEIARPLLPVAYVLVYLHICGNGNAQCLSSENTEEGIIRMLEAAVVPN